MPEPTVVGTIFVIGNCLCIHKCRGACRGQPALAGEFPSNSQQSGEGVHCGAIGQWRFDGRRARRI